MLIMMITINPFLKDSKDIASLINLFVYFFNKYTVGLNLTFIIS